MQVGQQQQTTAPTKKGDTSNDVQKLGLRCGGSEVAFHPSPINHVHTRVDGLSSNLSFTKPRYLVLDQSQQRCHDNGYLCIPIVYPSHTRARVQQCSFHHTNGQALHLTHSCSQYKTVTQTNKQTETAAYRDDVPRVAICPAMQSTIDRRTYPIHDGGWKLKDKRFASTCGHHCHHIPVLQHGDHRIPLSRRLELGKAKVPGQTLLSHRQRRCVIGLGYQSRCWRHHWVWRCGSHVNTTTTRVQ